MMVIDGSTKSKPAVVLPEKGSSGKKQIVSETPRKTKPPQISREHSNDKEESSFTSQPNSLSSEKIDSKPETQSNAIEPSFSDNFESQPLRNSVEETHHSELWLGTAPESSFSENANNFGEKENKVDDFRETEKYDVKVAESEDTFEPTKDLNRLPDGLSATWDDEEKPVNTPDFENYTAALEHSSPADEPPTSPIIGGEDEPDNMDSPKEETQENESKDSVEVEPDNMDSSKEETQENESEEGQENESKDLVEGEPDNMDSPKEEAQENESKSDLGDTFGNDSNLLPDVLGETLGENTGDPEDWGLDDF
jgi:hypothetical protein